MHKPFANAPNQLDSKRLLDDTLKHGDREDIADMFGCTPATISQQCNPNDEFHKSWLGHTKRLLWACFYVNRSAFHAIWGDLCAFVKGMEQAADIKCLDAEFADVGEEFSRLLKAKLCGHKPDDVRQAALRLTKEINEYVAAHDATHGMCADGAAEHLAASN